MPLAFPCTGLVAGFHFSNTLLSFVITACLACELYSFNHVPQCQKISGLP